MACKSKLTARRLVNKIQRITRHGERVKSVREKRGTLTRKLLANAIRAKYRKT